MIMFIPSIPGPYYVGTDLSLICTVTLDPDDNNYEHVNTWMSGPDEVLIPIRRSQRQYIRIERFTCISDQNEGSYTCRAGLIDNPDVEVNATINIEILGMCIIHSRHIIFIQIFYTILNRSTISCCIHNTNQWTANCRTILLPHLLCSDIPDTNNNSLYMDRYE